MADREVSRPERRGYYNQIVAGAARRRQPEPCPRGSAAVAPQLAAAYV